MITKEIIINSTKAELTDFCKELGINYTKKNKNQLQDELIKFLEDNVNTEEAIVEKPIVEEPIVEEKPKTTTIDLTSNKSIYNNYLKENKAFLLYYNNGLVYDSQKHLGTIQFEEEYFILNGSKYSYKNLKFKFKYQ